MSTDELLKSLADKIDSLESALRVHRSLGLTSGRRFIYIQNTKRSLWSFIDDDEPVKADAIKGYITEIKRKPDEVPKLHVVIDCGTVEYVLCSGIETHFSRDIMSAIAQLKPQDLKQPLKVIPCLKEVQRKDSADKTVKKPVYANVLLHDRTLFTNKLKQQYEAEVLFQMATAALNAKDEAPKFAVRRGSNPSQRPNSTQAQVESVPTPHLVETSSVETFDWKSFCQKNNILPANLKLLAQQIGLPMGKLTPSQSADLYQAANRRLVKHN